ncbi:MAG: FAD:protein FMN transferase [Planctomycetota bacterium]|nr:FAD:protein FMN transferase [Planctomycetota bacterium]
MNGKSSIDVLRHLVDASLPGIDASNNEQALQPNSPTKTNTSRTYLTKIERRAMACNFEVFFNAGEYAGAEEAALQALDLIDQLEEQLTIYRPFSEISRLCHGGHLGPMRMETRLFALLVLAQRLHRETQGAFDVTSGALSTIWGFSRRMGRVPSELEIQNALKRVGTEQLDFFADKESICLKQAGVEVNLGAIGKGYALDRCAEQFLESGYKNFLLHGGQSSVLACGTRTGPKIGWTIGIRHPQRPDSTLLEILLVNRALGTSGTATQSFYQGGKRYGHILDPRTGLPVDSDVFSVSAVAEIAAEADALATAFFVLGSIETEKYCQQHPKVGALFIRPTDKSGDLQVEVYGAIEPSDLKICHPSARLLWCGLNDEATSQPPKTWKGPNI